MRDRRQTLRTEQNLFVMWLSLVLVLLAGAIFRMTEFDRNFDSGNVIAWIFVEAATVLGIFVWLQRVSRRISGELVISPLLLVLVIASLLWESASRQYCQNGRSFEFAVMFVLKNLMFGMGTVLFVQRIRLFALTSSLFLVTFSAAMSRNSRVGFLLGLYALGGVVWLLAQHWNSLRYRLLPHADERHVPWKRISLVLLFCFVPLIALGTSSEQIIRLSNGWLPGSGGTDGFDLFARDGVGDGDMLIAGQDNITSFAPIEDAPFISDEEPSLYDVFDDSYQEPVTTTKHDRAIALPPNTSRELETRLARSNQASREFSTLRKSVTQRPSQIKDLNTNALMFVSGRVPLHLRMETYDIFDGVVWHAEPPMERLERYEFQFKEVQGKPWLITGHLSGSLNFEQTVEPHAIKVATIDTVVIPSPVNLLGLHIDRVDRPEMFGWFQDSLVKMNRDRLPEAVTIRLSSGLVDPDSIGRDHNVFGSTKSNHRALPLTQHMKQIKKLASVWTSDADRGWPQVQAIMKRLRENYHHDPAARPPGDCVFPVGDFLLTSKRGEDYQFATAAAVLLRSIGFSTRLVSGFYASPENYDSRTGLTPVYADDIHFWAEVYLGDDVWQTLEATPGFDTLQPKQNWSERLSSCAFNIGIWTSRHLLLIGLSALLGIWIFANRREVVIRYHNIYDRCFPANDEREAVLRTARHLERCLSAAGSRRPPGVPPLQWIERQGLQMRGTSSEWERFSHLWNRTLFFPYESHRPLSDDVDHLCRQVRKRFCVSEMKQYFGGTSRFRVIRDRVAKLFPQTRQVDVPSLEI